MRHDTSCKRPDFKNSSAERKSSTVKSSDRINLPVASRRESSSSTTESNRADDNSAPIRETITMRDDEPIVLSYKRLDAGEEDHYEGLALRRPNASTTCLPILSIITLDNCKLRCR